jgi:hypothetical protein
MKTETCQIHRIIEKLQGLSTEQIAALKEQLSGSACVVHEPGSRGYAQATRLWNGTVDRKPALVTACSNTNDVRTALLAARDGDAREQIGSAFGPNGQRLLNLKGRFDPGNIFSAIPLPGR